MEPRPELSHCSQTVQQFCTTFSHSVIIMQISIPHTNNHFMAITRVNLCNGHHHQLRTGEFCWSTVLLPHALADSNSCSWITYMFICTFLGYLISRLQFSTRHRASTSMYSLTFCVRFLLPERHQWKPAVQTAAITLRTPPSAAGRARPLPVCFYAAHGFGGAPRRPPVGSARRPRPASRLRYVVISRDGRKLVTRVRVMLP